MLVTTPTVSESKDGATLTAEGYRYQPEVNTAHTDHPTMSEDGMLVTEDALEGLQITEYHSVTDE